MTRLLKHHLMVDLMANVIEILQTSWMSENLLKMNDHKIEFIIYDSQQQLKNLLTDTLKVNETYVPTSNFIKYLGVYGRLGRSGPGGGVVHLKLQLYYDRIPPNFWSHNLCSELLFTQQF